MASAEGVTHTFVRHFWCTAAETRNAAELFAAARGDYCEGLFDAITVTGVSR